jgi:hypothetical protein
MSELSQRRSKMISLPSAETSKSVTMNSWPKSVSLRCDPVSRSTSQKSPRCISGGGSVGLSSLLLLGLAVLGRAIVSKRRADIIGGWRAGVRRRRRAERYRSSATTPCCRRPSASFACDAVVRAPGGGDRLAGTPSYAILLSTLTWTERAEESFAGIYNLKTCLYVAPRIASRTIDASNVTKRPPCATASASR